MYLHLPTTCLTLAPNPAELSNRPQMMPVGQSPSPLDAVVSKSVHVLYDPVQLTQPNSSGGPMQSVVDSDASGGIGV